MLRCVSLSLTHKDNPMKWVGDNRGFGKSRVSRFFQITSDNYHYTVYYSPEVSKLGIPIERLDEYAAKGAYSTPTTIRVNESNPNWLSASKVAFKEGTVWYTYVLALRDAEDPTSVYIDSCWATTENESITIDIAKIISEQL